MASSSYSNSSCAACKILRRKCLPDCILAPYFPPEDTQKFLNVQRLFGARNVCKLLNEIDIRQREDTVNSLAYEAEARMKDPVYGCVGTISILQRQILSLQNELDAAKANLVRLACNGPFPAPYHQRRLLIHQGGSSYAHQNADAVPNYQYSAFSNISTRDGSFFGQDN